MLKFTIYTLLQVIFYKNQSFLKKQTIVTSISRTYVDISTILQ